MEAYTTAKGGASSSEAGLYDAAATSSLFSDYRRSATALILAEHIRVGAHEAVEVCFAQHQEPGNRSGTSRRPAAARL
jgi:hypothetical protein